QEMIRRGAVLGGEESGHIIFLQHHSTGDGMLSALQLVAAMEYLDRPLSELAQLMEVFPQVLLNVSVTRKPLLSEIPEVSEVIKKVENELGRNGRVLVRYSGTESVCRVMVEGDEEDKIKNYAEEIAAAIVKSIGE
ncbi:MAG TPA: phosphoglucosamine mutase, partial [Desulfobacterales bacterium]|nr:phosphoglucosamine mutase [Desulfobacterales bacterium]